MAVNGDVLKVKYPFECGPPVLCRMTCLMNLSRHVRVMDWIFKCKLRGRSVKKLISVLGVLSVLYSFMSTKI